MKSTRKDHRRYRIMRRLGLTPPIGSPFSPNNNNNNSDIQKKSLNRYYKQVSKKVKFANPHEQFDLSLLDLERRYSYLMEEACQLPGVLKQGLMCLDSSELERLNERWRLQQIDEAKLLVKRDRLIQEKNNLILEALSA